MIYFDVVAASVAGIVCVLTFIWFVEIAAAALLRSPAPIIRT